MASNQGFSSQGLDTFKTEFRKLVDDGKLPSVVTLISRNGHIVNHEAYGVLDVSQPDVPAQIDSIYRIASMTKPVAGVAMMILWEEGKWAMEDPIAKHIPEFDGLQVKQEGVLVPQDSPMNMKQLMSHTAGFDRSSAYSDLNLRDGDLQSMINKLSKEPLAFQPGKDWRYGPSVDIQGYLVEKLSGQGLDEFLQQRLFGPLKMTDTGFWIDESKRSRVSRIHKYDDSRKLMASGDSNVLNTKKPRFLSGGGGLVSKIEDYWRFCQMLLNGGEMDGQRYLKTSTVELMHKSVLEPGVNVTLYSPHTRGLGFGMDFAVIEDAQAAKTSQGVQSFYWGGFFGTWFWIDPLNQMIVIGFIQLVDGTKPDGAPEVRELSAKLAYQAMER
ncbi:beta-lactamase/transpeptidase-like protein [Microthyrium microscopicum]|uniref:Beta-lactamase/transpeptidase-like protein n=1 Tax=Microthyrium microscopicum TaxID=703497 RepID=A0A6A6URE3_9PEZI|nr:beta-lactamase/transpeptidase-like protein [Microthyrium microscopicum]